jgi:hypothetical protein
VCGANEGTEGRSNKPEFDEVTGQFGKPQPRTAHIPYPLPTQSKQIHPAESI